jgi:hypothetical protein
MFIACRDSCIATLSKNIKLPIPSNDMHLNRIRQPKVTVVGMKIAYLGHYARQSLGFGLTPLVN